MSQSPRYWEKTVEYAFVLQASKIGNMDFVSPLSGKEEHAAGDAIFGSDDKLILVEFKVDQFELNTEEKLFKEYDDAHAKMCGRDAHHFLVYSSKTPKAGQMLPPLKAETYFSAASLPSPMACFGHGASPDDFKSYVADLFELKHADGRSSSGQISPDTLANVIGVKPGGTQVSTVTLYDYAREMFPDLVFEHTYEMTNVTRPGL